MAAEQATPRQAAEGGHERTQKVHGGIVSRRGRSPRVVTLPHAGVREPDSANSAPARSDRCEKPPRIDHLSDRCRHAVARSATGARGLDDPEAKGAGNLPVRQVLADGATPRDHTRSRRQSDRRAGETDSGSIRDGHHKVEKLGGEEPEPEQQIGNRRRGLVTKGSRDANPKTSRPEERTSRDAGQSEVRGGSSSDSPGGSSTGKESTSRAEARPRAGGRRKRRKSEGERKETLLAPRQEEERELKRRRETRSGEKPHSEESPYEQESFETITMKPSASELG